MTVYIGSDHRGFPLKEWLKEFLTAKGHAVVDKGDTSLQQTDDYVDFAVEVGKSVSLEERSRGIVICGSGIGVCIASNKLKGVRCGLCSTVNQTKSAREDDNINVLALAGDYLTHEQAAQLVETFLDTSFSEEERHVRRLEKIRLLEQHD